jgi:hypothetical protein
MASDEPKLKYPIALSGEISLYEPQDTADAADASAPSLIILCTWVGGATPRRINKYTSQYRQLYPGASILILTTNVQNVAFRPLSMVRSGLKPACESIRRILTRASDTNDRPGTLLHMFSHGGGGTGSQLALAMKASDDQGALFFANLRIILDCCPGDDSLNKSYGAAQVSVPNNLAAQLLGKALLYPAMSVINGLQNAGVLRSIRDLRALLNDPNTFGPSARRLYIYTKDDPVIGWTDVQTHLQEARSLGYHAEQVLFEHGAHCGLIMENPGRYWGAVRKFWNGENIADLTASDPEQVRLCSRL